jgi:hypothetical protein
MAAKKVTKVTVTLTNPQPKKSVVRYDADDADGAALSNVYVDKAALTKLGDPDTIIVTIEAG